MNNVLFRVGTVALTAGFHDEILTIAALLSLQGQNRM